MKKQTRLRYFAVFMILNISFEIISPSLALALTNGSIQPEFTGFEPANSSEMVDLFTGDFKYNIPLMDVDGYPLNLSYHAGSNMETEASWVGLGWSLNPGVLNRMMKGLPDDFNGDQVHSEVKMKPYISTGAGVHNSVFYGQGFGVSAYYVPIFGGGGQYGIQKSFLLTYNNYKGYGFEKEYDSHFSWSISTVLASLNKSSAHGVTLNSQDGGSFTDTYTSGMGIFADKYTYSLGKGTNYNTRNGAITNTYLHSNSTRFTSMVTTGNMGSYSIPSGMVAYPPSIPTDLMGGGHSNSLKAGFWSRAGFMGLSATMGTLLGIKGFYNSMGAVNNVRDLKSYGFLYAQNADTSSLMDFNRFRNDAVMDETPYGSYASSTYDLFFASAQGMSSSFRPFRSDIGVVHDPNSTQISTSNHKGYELGMPFLVHYVKEKSSVNSGGRSKNWDNPLSQTLSFKSYSDLASVVNYTPHTNNEAFIEKYYFKEMGELTERDEDFEASILTDKLVSPSFVSQGAEYVAVSPIDGSGRKKRDKRSKYIQCLTASQADKYGFERKINLYDKNNFSINISSKLVTASGTGSLVNVTRTLKNSTNVSDHISEVSITNSDGYRYIYGIPAYNLSKKSVSFNASSRLEGPYVSNGTSLLFGSTSFSNIPLDVSEPCQFVNYTANEITDNKRGLDNFSKIEETPAYASSFLLTSILSTDYVDITGDGPSYDDIGNFTKFNYSKENNYKWREPFCVDPAVTGTVTAGSITTNTSQAHFEHGLICDKLDDGALYQYGVRENYYVHSIESKNFVAVFRTSGRQDGMGVQDEVGTMGTTSEMLKLDAVELYSKNEILSKGGITNAVPIKSVHFEYDYSLCPGTFNTLSSGNTTRGKLTLTKIYFTYGSSKKSALSPYTFKYANNDHASQNNNYTYQPTSVDRWGTYKPNCGTAVGGITTLTLNNIEFPYAEQNKQLADQYAAAWNLSEIKTPTGATIKITYESDDYGYVQDQPASQMCKIYNCVENIGSSSDNVPATYSPSPTADIKNNPFLIIDLSSMNAGIPASLSFSDATTYARQFLFSGDQDNSPKGLNSPYKPLYYKCFLKVAGPECGAGITEDFHEFINGYATMKNIGLFDASVSGNTYIGLNASGTGTVNCYRFAYVSLNRSQVYQGSNGSINDKNTSPISVAGWDFLRNYAPRIAYPGSEPANIGVSLTNPLSQLFNAKAGLGVAEIDLENGKLGNPNKRFYDNDFCRTLYPAKSFVRVYSANYKKLGGGHRVKQITTEDNWDAMTNALNTSAYSETESVYGQAFDYTTKTQSNQTISSGVASYEPLVGGDENSLRQPISFEVIKNFAPNDHFFQDAPLGEMLYPSPIVGYSKVTMKVLSDPSVSNVTGIGKTEFEFYTAKDFPIKDITQEPQKQTAEFVPEEATLTNFINRLDNPEYEAYKIFHLAQGNILKLNDMHGKLKSIATFGEDNPEAPVFKTEFFYKRKGPDLVTSVPTINEKNVISSKVISRDIDITADARENLMKTQTKGVSKLFEWGLMLLIIPVYPFVVISPDVPTIHKDSFPGETTTGFKGASITKVVQEYGILEKIVTTNNGAKTTTENLLWDANTGSVVLTRERNELDQPVYSFNYPAYWAHKEMSQEFKRDGIALYCPSTSVAPPLLAPLDLSTGKFDHSNLNDPVIFEIGDEVMVTDVTNPAAPVKIGERFWFIREPNFSSSFYLLVDQNGKALTTTNYTSTSTSNNYEIRLVRPINKNKLEASMGYVNSLSSPQNTTNASIDYNQAGQKIIDAGAQEYCSGAGIFIDPLITAPQTQMGMNLPLGSYTAVNNPIIAGTYGDHKPSNSYKYKTTRSYGTQPDIRSDGLYPASGSFSFSPFWFFESGAKAWSALTASACNNGNGNNPLAHGNWRAYTKNSYYSPYGQLIQQDNAIGVTSSQRFGFNHTLPILEANNARANEVGFDSFEEYVVTYPYLTGTSTNTSSIFNNDHLGFYGQSSMVTSTQPSVTSVTSHTGRHSFLFNPSQTVDLKYTIRYTDFNRPSAIYDDHCACLIVKQALNCTKLDLDYKPYVISMWVKGTNPAVDFSNLVNLSVKQTYTSTPTPVTYTPVSKSAIINGWQKLDYEVQISAITTSTTPSTLEFIISSGSTGGFYMDDFRIQPFNSTMVCKVYDPYQLRLVAELDDRNYATIYEYDNEGALVRKKKETSNTIYTVIESRAGKNKR